MQNPTIPSNFSNTSRPPNDQAILSHGYTVISVVVITKNKEVTIAIIDTGIDYYHPEFETSLYHNSHEVINGIDDDKNGYIDDLNGYRWLDWMNDNIGSDPFDDHGHGTHLAGIIGANANSKGIMGINPDAILMPLKIFNQHGKATQLEAAYAIRYAVDQGVDIINCSWGYFKKTKVLQEAIEYAIQHDVIVIASVGNYASAVNIYPASFEGVIGVGSVSMQQTRSEFSSFGNSLDFMAYGESLFSTLPNDGYGYRSGTSQSTALLTGIVSKLLSYEPAHTTSDIESILVQSSMNPVTKTKAQGYGVINPHAVLAGYNQSASVVLDAMNSSIDDTSLASDFMNFPNPVTTGQTTFGFMPLEENLSATIYIFNTSGEQIDEFDIDVDELSYTSIEWDASHLINGLYFTVLRVTSDTNESIYRNKCVILN